jgi:aryl-alcohol dehydrogenase-like predicted oxidoreductase
VQNRFDPLNGESLPGVLDLCVSEGVSFVPYSPLAKGLLTERYLDPAKVGPGDRLFDEGSFADIGDDKLAAVRRLAELAAEWEIKVSTLTLAYILQLPGMGTQIPSSSTIAQLEDNAAAAKITLDDDQLGELREVFTV